VAIAGAAIDGFGRGPGYGRLSVSRSLSPMDADGQGTHSGARATGRQGYAASTTDEAECPLQAPEGISVVSQAGTVAAPCRRPIETAAPSSPQIASFPRAMRSAVCDLPTDLVAIAACLSPFWFLVAAPDFVLVGLSRPRSPLNLCLRTDAVLPGGAHLAGISRSAMDVGRCVGIFG
jgi:hypothetical protein